MSASYLNHAISKKKCFSVQRIHGVHISICPDGEEEQFQLFFGLLLFFKVFFKVKD